MGMFGDIGAGIGATIGGFASAKGAKKAGDIAHWSKQDAEDAREMIDPSHKNRKWYGTEAHDIMSGEKEYENTADFAHAQKYGMQGIERSNAAKGLLHSGSAMTDAGEFNMGLAYQNMNSYLDRLGNWGSLGQAAGIAGGQQYGNMMSERTGREMQAKMSKYDAIAGANVAGHGTVGNVADLAVSFMSDVRLKKNIKRIGKDGSLYRYRWSWNDKAKDAFGLEGEQEGYIAQEVKKVMPEAIAYHKGYMAIDYGYINELQEVAA